MNLMFINIPKANAKMAALETKVVFTVTFQFLESRFCCTGLPVFIIVE